ncbi:MAG: hypothetical protein MUE67_07315 [Anaerolineales bacterium]|nr:hypothetical protein [Anaerolineales bacterium]
MAEPTPAQEKQSPAQVSVAGVMPVALILVISGLGGLFLLYNFTQPNGGTRWLFFFAEILAATGLFLPLVAFINQRFPSQPPVGDLVITRQALWFGVFLATITWLQIGRVLNSQLALLLAVGLVIIEWLLRLRERSQWKP